jgi:hypothetical protein
MDLHQDMMGLFLSPLGVQHVFLQQDTAKTMIEMRKISGKMIMRISKSPKLHLPPTQLLVLTQSMSVEHVVKRS